MRILGAKTRRYELANSATHGMGLALSVAGCAVLVTLAALRGNAWHIVACSVYGATLVCLYAASTVYHSVRGRRLKRVLRVMDHSSIFLLIAGTYTPFALVSLRGAWGWSLFGVVWGLSLVGILFKVWFVDRVPIASTVVYVLMGWLVVIAVKPVLALVPLAAILWLAAGGLLYTAGVAFFAWERLPYHHAVWHVFVLGGSVCHYVAVLWYVVPARSVPT
ncbi:MAG TPA: hemolysin III family protein [Candidatus Acidoferrales bacterium]|nr:hemolysin III family protein [Candidatus Acidoferrales bacterium]